VTLFILSNVVDMAHVNKLKSNVFRIATAVTSIRTQSCVRYECFVSYANIYRVVELFNMGILDQLS